MDNNDNLISYSQNEFKKKYPNLDFQINIIISIKNQKLYLLKERKVVHIYKISTSKFGLGNENDSFMTPLGFHYIAEKIGSKLPKNTILKGRKPLKNNITLDDLSKNENLKIKHEYFNSSEDIITSRILWLQGLEDGINKGGNVDTYKRYIYIHGTIHENLIGSEASHGCIRMYNDDVINLFELVEVNTPVHIINI